ncbi:MAG: nucleotidyltransferase domain-containing protein [Deltaproteobacteria bacterium]|nr:nucleotidyltransferase domain-containing protein [Deltaproteobacteria bacterium]
MKDNDSALRDRDSIARALSPHSEVEAALLFGSRACGSNTAESDFDVAVLLKRSPNALERKDVIRNLIAALAREFNAQRLDVVILNDAPNLLAFHVLKHGLVAFERSPEPLHRFAVRTYSTHADFEPTERFFRNVTKQRLQSGSAHG